MKLVELKAKVYDILARKQALDVELNRTNQEIASCCVRCKVLPCECKKEEKKEK